MLASDVGFLINRFGAIAGCLGVNGGHIHGFASCKEEGQKEDKAAENFEGHSLPSCVPLLRSENARSLSQCVYSASGLFNLNNRKLFRLIHLFIMARPACQQAGGATSC